MKPCLAAMVFLLGLAIGGTALFVVAALQSPPKGIGESACWVGLILNGVLFGVFVVMEARTRIALTPDGLRGVSGWRWGEITIRWDEVSSVWYSKFNRTFVIESYEKKRIRASIMLVGIRTLIAACREHLPPEKYAKAALGIRRLERHKT